MKIETYSEYFSLAHDILILSMAFKKLIDCCNELMGRSNCLNIRLRVVNFFGFLTFSLTYKIFYK